MTTEKSHTHTLKVNHPHNNLCISSHNNLRDDYFANTLK